jgi:hypothetical protein
VIDPQRMLKSGVPGARIDAGHQSQLADFGQPLELGRVDERTDAGRERDVLLMRNANETATRFEIGEFGNRAQIVAHGAVGVQALACLVVILDRGGERLEPESRLKQPEGWTPTESVRQLQHIRFSLT